jgi:hypothetical protein
MLIATIIVAGQCLCALIILSERQVDASYDASPWRYLFLHVSCNSCVSWVTTLKLSNQRLKICSCLIILCNQENENTTNILECYELSVMWDIFDIHDVSETGPLPIGRTRSF